VARRWQLAYPIIEIWRLPAAPPGHRRSIHSKVHPKENRDRFVVTDLSVLQRLIDDKVFSKTQTYELQSLGIAFGDVLASELPLRWVMVTDEYGTDPTLRFKGTAVQINALTIISKRIEKAEKVNLSELLRITREQLTRLSESDNP
jgi:hypothetical protein